jgi:hypothetical protein
MTAPVGSADALLQSAIFDHQSAIPQILFQFG